MRRKIISALTVVLLVVSILNLAFTEEIEQSNFMVDEKRIGTYENDVFNVSNGVSEPKNSFCYEKNGAMRLVVGLSEKELNYSNFEEKVSTYYAKIVNTISIEGEIKTVVIEIPHVTLSAFVEEIRIADLVTYIEPSIKVQAQFVPDDPGWDTQWALQKIQAEWAWNITMGNHDVLVAVVDTGIDWNHLDLIGNYAALGYDWVNGDADPMDDCGHGTHCAGLIAAVLDNSIGIAGLAQVRIMAEKVLNSHGEGYSDWVADGIVHAVEQGANIISMSFGTYENSEVVYEAIKYAYDADVLLVAASGNEDTDMKFHPAGHDEVIAVTATDRNDAKASFSNFGEWIELSAPGVDVYSTFLDNGYKSMNGTSMACPHVSGLAALTMSVFPDKTVDWIRLLLRYTADDLGDQSYDIYYGYGRINARKALQMISIKHELTAFQWVTPQYLELGVPNTVRAEIFNFGKVDETNISIQLLANNSIVGCYTLEFLAYESFAFISIELIPSFEGLYNLTLYVVPVLGEENVENNVLTKYIHAGSPVKAVVLHSAGNSKSEIIKNWNVLNNQWQRFGNQMIYVDYISLNKDDVTYKDILSTEADVLIISCANEPENGWEFKSCEIDAIKRYVREGHGLIVTADSFNMKVPNNKKLAQLLGLKADLNLRWYVNHTNFLQILNFTHPLFDKTLSPIVFPLVGTAIPYDGNWDSDHLAGGDYIALGHFNESAIIEFQGLLYISPWLEIIPPYYHHHLQLIYNAIVWSKYQKPRHELTVSLDCPQYLDPLDEILLNGTVFNIGLENESNVEVSLSIDGNIVNTVTIPELPASSTYTISYLWNATVENEYNISIHAPPVSNESQIFDNLRSKIIFAHFPRFVLWDSTHSNYAGPNVRKYFSIQESLRANGFIIDVLENTKIDSELLLRYDLLVLPASNLDFSSDEVAHILEWVNQGGSMLLAVDIGFTSTLRMLTLPYGVQIYRHRSREGTTSNIINHPTTQDVSSIYYASAVTLGVESPSQVLAWAMEGSIIFNLLSATESNDVVIITDTNTLEDEGVKRADNQQLILNIFHWLALKPLRDHDLTITLKAPNHAQKGDIVSLNVRVRNHGLQRENHIKTYLLINDTTVKSVTIAFLPPGDFYTFNYSWTPIIIGDYNITAYVLHVPGENLTVNNIALKKVPVSFYKRFYFPNKWLEVGSPMGWHADDGCWSYSLPFNFPFYHSLYNTTHISSNGLITFVNPDLTRGNSIEALSAKLAIAPAWHDWTTYEPYDIYIWQPDPSHVLIRWYVCDKEGIIANFEVVLGDDGVIQFNYGYNNQFVASTIGISSGTGHMISERTVSLNNIHTIVFAPLELEHELAVQLDAPNFLSRADSAVLNVTVFNHGLVNEKDVRLQLMINSTVVDSDLIPELSVGSFYRLSWLWTPMEQGRYNVTAYSLPIPGEMYTGNNIDAKTTFVSVNITTYISIHPQATTVTVGDVFTISIRINNVENLHAWQLLFYHNSAILECVGAWIPTENVFAGRMFISPEPLIEKNYTMVGATLTGGERAFTGSGILCQLQFKAICTGESTLHFDAEDSFLLNPALKAINCKLFDGTVIVEDSSTILHDVAVTVLKLTESELYLGLLANINVTVSNVGEATENFNVAIYCNTTFMGTQAVFNLAPGENVSLTFRFVTEHLRLYVNYSLSAQASVVVGETHRENNVLSDGNLIVKLVGDVNGDASVNILDFSCLGLAFDSYPNDTRWNQNADLNRDGTTDMIDILTAWMHFRQNAHSPSS